MVTSLLLSCFLALQGSPPSSPPPPSGDARPMVLEGRPGVWLPLESARRLLDVERQHQGCDLTVRKLLLVEDLAAVRLKEIDLLKGQLTAEKAVSEGLSRQVAEAAQRVERLEAVASKWYRSPVTLIVTGLAVGFATTYAVTR